MPVDSFKNVFAIADLRNRVLFTLALLGVYRVGTQIPTPGVNTEALRLLAEQMQNQMLGLYDMFTGGNLSNVTIFALGVMPYSQRFDHSAVVDGRVAVPRTHLQGGRARTAENHAVPRGTARFC